MLLPIKFIIHNSELACMLLGSFMSDDRVNILLATYNGAGFLPEQLQSIAAQTHRNWHLIASDDGSTDDTIALLEAFSAEHSATVVRGPQQGYVANFLSMLCRADAEADYAAFCDQDDVWHPDKLSRAIKTLQGVPAEVPAMVGTRTCYINANGDKLGLSPLFAKSPSFANALVQSLAGGNTMLFNRAAQQLLQRAGIVDIPIHDWWAYQLISGAGGWVIYDPEPSLLYRQHEKNIIGMHRGWRARCVRIRGLLHGRFKEWNDCSCAALRQNQALLSAENRAILERFASARESLLLWRVIGLYRCGIYRQTALGNVGLAMAALVNRI